MPEAVFVIVWVIIMIAYVCFLTRKSSTLRDGGFLVHDSNCTPNRRAQGLCKCSTRNNQEVTQMHVLHPNITKLRGMEDRSVVLIWHAIWMIAPEDRPDEEWIEDVYAELSDRGLPTLPLDVCTYLGCTDH
jgi:hypothetical protein